MIIIDCIQGSEEWFKARAESVEKILKSEHKRVLDAVMKAKVAK